MPGKEAVIEVEKAVVPEPVTKEVPKPEETTKGKKDGDAEPLKTTETAPVADSVESKPEETEITSSEEKKTVKEDLTSKADKEETVQSTNGSAAKLEDKTEKSNAVENSAVAETKPEESSNDKVEPSEVKTSEAESKVQAEASEDKAESTVAKSSEAEVSESKTVPTETGNTANNSEEVVDSMETETKSSEAAPAEAMEDVSVSSEAAAKPLPGDDEKIVVEKESKPENPDVSGSDEVVKDVPKDGNKEDETSVDSSTEKKPETPSSSETNTEDKPGSSSTTEVKQDVDTQISELKKKGLSLFVNKEYCAAADEFGKLLELQAPLYGEMSEKLAETYFLYGSAMFEYGKQENGVLGEKVKEKDEEEEEDDGEDEEMEVDNEAETATSTGESSAEKPIAPADEAKDTDKEPADVTITGDEKEDDDDAFRVAWEMLELAKATFLKADNKKRLADTLVKLGEVGIEIENAEAMAEMEKGLEIRREVFPANHRIISETHFNIGLAYAAFDKYDEAIQHFSSAKDALQNRIDEMSKSETKEDKAEVEEMKSLIPEIQEKINDTKESKADKEKLKEKIEGELLKKSEPATPFPAPSGDKPVSNITHLVKRKRKVDEILPEKAANETTVEETKAPETKPASEKSADAATAENVPIETEAKKIKLDPKPEDKTDEVEKKTENEPAKEIAESESKPDEVSDEAVKPTKTEDVKETKSTESEKMEE